MTGVQTCALPIFVVSLSTVILPELSSNAKKGEWEDFNKNLVFGIKLTAMISIPATVFTLLMRYEIVTLLFKHGKFDDKSVELTAYALAFHISGIFFIAVTRILFPAFFAQEDTVSPTIAGVASVVVNVVAAYLLVGTMKGGGIALASTISAFVSAVILILMLRKGGKIDLSKVAASLAYSLKFLLISIFCGIPIYFLKGLIYDLFSTMSTGSALTKKVFAEFLPLSVVTALFGFLLISILLVMKDENILFIFDKVLRRIKWKK